MKKLLTSPRARAAFKEAAKHKTDTLNFLVAWKAFSDIVDEE